MLDIGYIKELIKEGQLEKAFKTYLENAPKEDISNSFNVLSHRYRSLQNQRMKGVVYEENYQVELNRIADEFLAFLKRDIKKETITINPSRKWLYYLFFLTLALLVVILLMKEDVVNIHDSTNIHGDQNKVYNLEGENSSVIINSDSISTKVEKTDEDSIN